MKLENSGKIRLDGTNITEMTRGSGDGRGIVGSVGNGCEFAVKGNSVFEECVASNENGGGMMMSESGSGKVRMNGVKFKGCGGKTGSRMGGGIYLSVSGSSTVCSFYSLLFDGNTEGVGRDMYCVSPDLRTAATPPTHSPLGEIVVGRKEETV
jgi:hypothetical protein